jgi:cob(I)alamin adenosyltransferase
VSIYTKRGDSGQTHLLSGEAVPKDHLRVKTYGALDELQSLIGMARAFCGPCAVASVLEEIQKDLFIASAELATGAAQKRLKRQIDAQDVARLEKHIDQIVKIYGMPSGFRIPGAGADSAAVHVARAVCRRCERLMVTLYRLEGGRDALLSYANRLGDLLFMIAWALEVRAAVKNALMDILNEQKGWPR